MLKLRNISLMRRLYVWMLSLMTRIAYWGNLRNRQPAERKFDIHRVKRINSELERNASVWKDDFLAFSNSISASSTDPSPPFNLAELTPFVADGVEAIVGDTLTRCFNASSPDPWNFLTRTAQGSKNFAPYWTLLWLVGIWVRYCFLLPIRVFILIAGVLCFVVGFACTYALRKDSAIAIFMRKFLIRFLCSVCVASWSGYVRYYGQRPRPRANQIYVANHTSLIDVFILVKDYNFSFIGQRHVGLAGFLQDILHTAQDHVWFDREEGRDRRSVHRLLLEHVSDGRKEPMLVFPEGTCTNSDYCIMFKKGSFELGSTVYPIAMRYRKRFGDPFWNSRTTGFPRHLYDLMTSWALVCDVYYLDPMEQEEGESGVQFSSRVRKVICEKAQLTSFNWDGFLKRHPINPKFQKRRQEALSEIIRDRLNGDNGPDASANKQIEEDSETHQVLTTGIDLDTLELGRLMRELHPAEINEDKGEETTIGNESKVSGLRQRFSRTRPGRMGSDDENGLLRRAEHTARDVTKWMIGISMFSLTVIITWMFFPRTWIEYMRGAFA